MLPNNQAVIASQVANKNINSVLIWANKIVRCSFQAVSTGNASGSLQVQGSNDYFDGNPLAVGQGAFSPANWSNVGSAITVSGAAVYITPEIECSYEYLQLVYTDSSGGTATGTIAARIKSMGL